MRPLIALSNATRRAVRGVLLDIDDMLTIDGWLTAEALAALAELRTAGKLVVPVTGRPAGWCDHMARMWPVDAIVGENGAFYFRYDHDARRMTRRYQVDGDAIAANRAKFQAIGEQIVAAVPGAAIAADQAYRETDSAIDFCKDVRPLERDAIDQIVRLMIDAGMTVKVISIHVNGWFGAYDKLTMIRQLFDEVFHVNLDQEKKRFVFVGDSPNDQPAFAYFPIAVGVANIRDFSDQLKSPPAFVTEGRAGDGFVELTSHLLAD